MDAEWSHQVLLRMHKSLIVPNRNDLSFLINFFSCGHRQRCRGIRRQRSGVAAVIQVRISLSDQAESYWATVSDTEPSQLLGLAADWAAKSNGDSHTAARRAMPT